MKNKMKRCYLDPGAICATLVFGLFFNAASAQVAAAVAGGDAEGDGGSASYTVGQITYTAYKQSNGSENQGVQQIGVENSLPVTLVSFDAKANGSEGVQLRWVTSLEVDNDYFAVERSMDGKVFRELMKVKGKGSIKGETNYDATDYFPNPGNNYYRLKQVDYDGTFAYSRTRVVNVGDSKVDLAVFPNPTTSYLNITSNGFKSENLSFQLSTVNGTILKSKILTSDKSVIDVSNLPSSVYLVSVLDAGNVVKTFKLVKE